MAGGPALNQDRRTLKARGSQTARQLSQDERWIRGSSVGAIGFQGDVEGGASSPPPMDPG